MTKKLIVLVIALSLFTTMLAGCNQQTPTQSGDSNQKEASSSSEKASDKKEPVTLRFMTFNNTLAEDTSGREFEKLHPNYKIEYEFIPYKDYFGKFMTYAASNDVPDVFFTQSANYIDHVDKKLLTDLSPYFDTPSYEEDSKWIDTFIPAVVDNARSILNPIEGKLKTKDYGVPFVMTSVAVLYDKNLFKTVGIEVPTTWDQFMSNNEKLKQAGYVPFSLVADWIDWYPRIFWDQYLRDEIAKDPKAFETGKLNFSDKRVQQALLDMKGMWDKGYLIESGLTAKVEEISQAFVQKKLAQFMVVPSRLGYIVENAPKDMDLATYVLPGINGLPSKTLGGSSQVVGISASTKKFDDALFFLKFLTSKTHFAMPHLKYEVPSLKENKKDPSLQNIMKGYADAAANGFIPEILVPAGITPQMREMFMQEHIPGLMLDKITVDKISEDLQKLYKETYLDKKQ